jgi:hypothetical protein
VTGRVLAVLTFGAWLALLCKPALAQQTKPLASLERIAVAAGASYDWHSGTALNPEPEASREFAPGLFAAYVLTPHLSGFGSAVYGVDNKVMRFSPGIHYRVGVGSEKIALAVTYDYYVGDGEKNVPEYPHEWAISLIYARAVTKNLVIGGSESYSTDNRELRTSVGIRVPIYLGKDS